MPQTAQIERRQELKSTTRYTLILTCLGPDPDKSVSDIPLTIQWSSEATKISLILGADVRDTLQYQQLLHLHDTSHDAAEHTIVPVLTSGG